MKRPRGAPFAEAPLETGDVCFCMHRVMYDKDPYCLP